MPAPHFQQRKHPQLFALLHRILERAHADLPKAFGISITVHDKRYSDEPTVLASRGIGSEIVDAQLTTLGGPVADALVYQVPVISLDLWADERWPRLTMAAMLARAPEHRAVWERVFGTAAVPGIWQDDATVVVSCILDRPATAATVATLITYEQLVSAAFVTTAADDAAGIEDMLAVLQSRGAIEQAKGAIMGCLGCDAHHAWTRLRRVSQENNVKLRALAVALLEHISGAPAEQPAFGTPINPDERTRVAAKQMWTTLTASARQELPSLGS